LYGMLFFYYELQENLAQTWWFHHRLSRLVVPGAALDIFFFCVAVRAVCASRGGLAQCTGDSMTPRHKPQARSLVLLVPFKAVRASSMQAAWKWSQVTPLSMRIVFKRYQRFARIWWAFLREPGEALRLDNFPVSPSTSPKTYILTSKDGEKKETKHHRINVFHVSIRVGHSRASWGQKHTWRLTCHLAKVKSGDQLTSPK
jgi:hypothetical protein